MIIIAFFIFHWYTSLFFQTFFHHRYSAHQMFTMSKRTEKVFYFLSWLFQGPSYLSPYAYGILHRLHHAYADTENDPHSPKYDDNLFKMMWKTRNVYTEIVDAKKTVDPKFMKNLPEWRSFDKFAEQWVSRTFWILVYAAVFYFFAPSIWYWILFPPMLVMGPMHGAIINWFAHKYGYVNFKVSDTSKNLLPFDFLMLGESYHNNHHKHGSRPNFGGFRWHEFDPIYPIIKLLDKLNVIHLKKPAPDIAKAA